MSGATPRSRPHHAGRCRPAHRQAAFRARHRDGIAASAPLDDAIGELAPILDTPGHEAQLALSAAARDVIVAAGHQTPVQLQDPRGPRLGQQPRRETRPMPWGGEPLPRPTRPINEPIYERHWADEWGWQIVVSTLRGERPIVTGKPLWLRRHRTGEDPNWRSARTSPIRTQNTRMVATGTRSSGAI